MRNRGSAIPCGKGCRAGLPEVSMTIAATTSVYPNPGEPRGSPRPSSGCSMGVVHQVQSFWLFLVLHLSLLWENTP